MSPWLVRISAPVERSELVRQFGHWRWLSGGNAVPLCMTLMGDWIFARPNGALCLLDTIDADIRVVAPDLMRLRSLLDSPEQRDALILEGLALAVLDGQPLPAGHCVGYRVPPVLGGATDRSNLEVVSAGLYQAWIGALQETLAQVPAGKRILGVELVEPGRVSVRWE